LKKQTWTICTDCDDVLLDLIPAWVAVLNCRHGTNVKPDDITDWDIMQFFPTLTRDQVYKPIIEYDFWRWHIEPKTLAKEFVGRLACHPDEFRLKVITKTDYRNVEPKTKALMRWFPSIKWEDIIVTSCKQDVACDVLIDDNPDNLVGRRGHCILIDMPHNRSFDVSEWDTIHRAYSLAEAYNMIRYLKDLCPERSLRRLL